MRPGGQRERWKVVIAGVVWHVAHTVRAIRDVHGIMGELVDERVGMPRRLRIFPSYTRLSERLAKLEQQPGRNNELEGSLAPQLDQLRRRARDREHAGDEAVDIDDN